MARITRLAKLLDNLPDQEECLLCIVMLTGGLLTVWFVAM
jgi:hypothetical protein